MIEQNGHERPREIDEDSPPSPPPSLERLAHQVREERTERLKQHGLQQHQIAGLAAEIGELSTLVRECGDEIREVRGVLASISAALADQAELLGRVLAALAQGERQGSRHEEAIEATRKDLALARAKWLGWRSLAAGIGWGALEALKHWIGG
jgi:ABC-type transporter Mla subunit MlaD